MALSDQTIAARPLNGITSHAVLRDVLAGAICSVLSVTYCLSYAALIFSGPLAPWLSYGIAVTFLSAAIAATVVALRSSFPFAIAGPDSSTAAVTATLVAAVAAHLASEGNAGLLPPAVTAIALATAATGVLLCVLGFTNAGRAVRFVPYPVIGGFLGATGWLMILGAIHLISDQPMTLSNLDSFFTIPIIAKLAAGLGVALTLQMMLSRWTNTYVMPGILIAVLLAFHIARPIGGWSLADAQAAGWVFQPQTTAVVSPWQVADLSAMTWTTFPWWLAGDVLAVMFVTTISLLLNTTGVEIASRREADISRELRALGIANLMTAAVGGYASCLSLSRTTLARSAGATGRMAGLTVAAASVTMVLIDPGFLVYVPKCILGGLLFFAGGTLLHRWLIASACRLQLLDYLSLIAIALIIVRWGFIAGVLLGVVIGCATFAFSASRVNAIKFSFDGSEYRSLLDRSPAELALLTTHGRELQGIALQSYLFFGSTNHLYEHVKTLLASRPECRFLIFDFHLVAGIDSSATHSFTQIKQAAGEIGARLVLVNLRPELHQIFHTNQLDADGVIVAKDLDDAMEICEQAIIDAHRAKDDERRPLVAWLTEALGSADYANILIKHCKRLEVEPGDDVARQGQPSDSMHFVLEGRIGVFSQNDDRIVRVRSLGSHTMIGEMGLITGRPRSATIQAELSSVLYQLPVEAYEHMMRHNPALAQALFKMVIEAMSERLTFANRVIGALQR